MSTPSPGFVQVPNPLLQLRTKGVLDLMDDGDLHAHLPKQIAKDLIKTCDAMRRRTPQDDRFDAKRVEVDVHFDVSLRQLLDFHGTIQERTAIINESCKKSTPVVVFPFTHSLEATNLRSEPEPLKVAEFCNPVIVLASTCRVTVNGFSGLLKEDIKFGCSLTEAYLDVQKDFQLGHHLVQHYLRCKRDGNLLFNVSSTAKQGEWSLSAPLPAEEMEFLSTMGLLNENLVKKGIEKVKLSELTHQPPKDPDQDPAFYYFPEEHGLSEVLKRSMPQIISSVRVYAQEVGVNHSKTFLRLPESCYNNLLQHAHKEIETAQRRNTMIQDIHFWIGYKCKGEEWVDKEELQRLEKNFSQEEWNLPRRVSLRVTVCWLSKRILPESEEDGDWFMSHRGTVGAWLPTACGYVDGLVYEADGQALRTIQVRGLPYYLKENHQLRKKIREATNLDGIEPKQIKTYREKLLEL